jgi:hypothetical protein
MAELERLEPHLGVPPPCFLSLLIGLTKRTRVQWNSMQSLGGRCGVRIV